MTLNPTTGHTSGENSKSIGYMHLGAHNSTIYHRQDMRQHKCPSIDGWTEKTWCTHTMEYDSDIKKSE